eukprot:15436729-Alexandrium_andersonii.AAC.1
MPTVTKPGTCRCRSLPVVGQRAATAAARLENGWQQTRRNRTIYHHCGAYNRSGLRWPRT